MFECRLARLALLAPLALAPVPALSGETAASQCAASLPADAKLIYDQALPGAAAGGDLQTVVKNAAVSLVQGGRISRSSARGAAQAAGACLKQL